MTCGQAKARDTSVAFETAFKLYFVKRGKIEFLYRKDSTKEKDGWVSGLFSFFVDDNSVLDDNNLNDAANEWKHFSYDVLPGMKDINFIYQKYNTEANSHMQLEIKELRITGIDYTDYECTPCSKGFSQEGEDRCSLCPKDNYLNPITGECIACPPGTHSLEGSIANSSEEVCKFKKNCTIEDIPKNYHLKCNKRIENPIISVNGGYFRPYNLDMTKFSEENCNLDKTVIDVQKTYDDAPCGFCEAGNVMKFNADDTIECERCADDLYTEKQTELKKGISQQCKVCPPGSYMKKGVSLSNFDELPTELYFLHFTSTCNTLD